MYTGQNTMRSRGVCVEVPLSPNQLVSLVPLQTAIQASLPAASASALQQLQAFTPPYWKKPQGASSNLSASFFHSRYSHSSCSSSCGTAFFFFFFDAPHSLTQLDITAENCLMVTPEHERPVARNPFSLIFIQDQTPHFQLNPATFLWQS